MAYDPEDDDGPPPAEPNRDPIKIAVETEITFGEVLDRVAWKTIEVFRARYHGEDARERVGRLIDDTITNAIEKRATALIDEKVTAAVEKALAEGWSEPKSYAYDRSEPKHVTLSSLVQHHLTANRPEDRYNDKPAGNVVEQTISKFVAQELSKMLTAELAAAKQKFQAAVDRLIEGKVLEAARAALKGG